MRFCFHLAGPKISAIDALNFALEEKKNRNERPVLATQDSGNTWHRQFLTQRCRRRLARPLCRRRAWPGRCWSTCDRAAAHPVQGSERSRKGSGRAVKSQEKAAEGSGRSRKTVLSRPVQPAAAVSPALPGPGPADGPPAKGTVLGSLAKERK